MGRVKLCISVYNTLRKYYIELKGLNFEPQNKFKNYCSPSHGL